MRLYLIGVIIGIIILFYLNKSKSYLIMPIKYYRTTLDSLQGKWISTSDSLNQVIISGRQYTEFYADADSTHENFRIYFSDTLVNADLSFSSIQIDTTATTGKYLITKYASDDSFWCYKFNGFHYDITGIVFSISDTWAKRRATAFKKQ